MTNVEALKALFIALGGDEDDFDATTNPEAISALAGVVAGGTLPEVSAYDDGKVLTVVDGAWAAVLPTP